MWNKLCKWYVRTFGPINQIQSYIERNQENFFDSGSFDNLTLTIKRWIPDAEKKLEIIQYAQNVGEVIFVYLDTKCIATYDVDIFQHPISLYRYVNIKVDANKDELEYLYSNICECFK